MLLATVGFADRFDVGTRLAGAEFATAAFVAPRADDAFGRAGSVDDFATAPAGSGCDDGGCSAVAMRLRIANPLYTHFSGG